MFDGIWTTAIVKLLTNNVENNICDEVNLLLIVLFILIINNKLATIINGIKLPYTAVNRIYSFSSVLRNNATHLASPWGNSVILFMARSKRNQ